MLVSDFDFHLPPELIAQHPPANSSGARMLHLDRGSQTIRDTVFSEIPQLLRPSDLVIFNNTRVLPARLFGHRGGQKAQPLSSANPAMKDFLRGKIEVLLTRHLAGQEERWQALVRPGRKIMPGEKLYFGEGSDELVAEVLDRGEFGERTIRFLPVSDFSRRLEALGHIPLPPYIDRDDTPEDRVRYQTVFAQQPGSVAAPTAGLHFTPEILERIKERHVETAEVTLHVGLGTFAPIRTDVVEEHHLHTEWYEIPEATAEAIAAAKREKRRVVAVGTTTVRTLEFAASRTPDGRIEAHKGEADIFIYPGFQFRVVDALLTNFHLPKSTLLMMVSAFAGREFVLGAYEHAVRQGYRFFSYGDCMFID